MAPQSLTEQVLSARAAELGVQINYGAKVVGLEQDDDGVAVQLADGTQRRARYVVGCDGAHSAVRELTGIDFTGKQYETHILLADVRLAQPRPAGSPRKTAPTAWCSWCRSATAGSDAIAWDRTREHVPLSEPVTLAEIKGAFLRIAKTDFGMTELRWSSRFLSERRQARRYRVGRVFIAGTRHTCIRRWARRA